MGASVMRHAATMLDRTISIVALLAAAGALAGEPRLIPLSGSDGTLEMTLEGPDNSDFLHYRVVIRQADVGPTIEFPPMFGPVLYSPANSQVFSCESNSIAGPKGPVAYDLAAERAFQLPHPGYLRSCGMTDDEKLYWLHYNLVKNRLPTNKLLVVDRTGRSVYETESESSIDAEFSVEGAFYRLSIPDPQFPG